MWLTSEISRYGLEVQHGANDAAGSSAMYGVSDINVMLFLGPSYNTPTPIKQHSAILVLSFICTFHNKRTG